MLYRNFSAGRISSVRPCRVISDDERGLLLWLAQGSAVLGLQATDGRGIRDMPFAEWVTLEHHVVPGRWQGPGLLKFIPPDADHSVWFFRDEQGRFTGWYVNLEERARRWDDGDVAGVDVVDQDLDIVAAPDRTWQWKDEDEFAERTGHPLYWTADEAAQIRAEGERLIGAAVAGRYLFDGRWCDFRPDPDWQPVQLPWWWDQLPPGESGPGEPGPRPARLFG